LLSDEKRADAVFVWRKIEVTRNDALQRFVGATLSFGVYAFGDYATRLAGESHKHSLIYRGSDRAHAWYGGKSGGERFVVAYAAGTWTRERNVGGHAEQAILKRFAEAGVHGQGDYQSRDAGGHTDDRK
jgi:hypothetical protein